MKIKNSPIPDQVLRELYAAPTSINELSVQFGVGWRVVRRWLLNSDIILRDMKSALKIAREQHKQKTKNIIIPHGSRQCRNPACKVILPQLDMTQESLCKTCSRAKFAAYRAANLEKVRARARAYSKQRYAAKKAANLPNE